MAVPESQFVPRGRGPAVSSGVYPRRPASQTPLPFFFEVNCSAILGDLASSWPDDLIASEIGVRPAAVREGAASAVQALFRAVLAAARQYSPAPKPAPQESDPPAAAPRTSRPAAPRLAVPTGGAEAGFSLPKPKPQPLPQTSEAGAREWELVLPRMPKLMQPPRKLRRNRGPMLEATYHPEVRFATDSEPALPARIWGNLSQAARTAIVAAILVPAAYFGWRAINPEEPASEVAASTFVMGQGGWMTDWATDLGGAKRGRQLTLYRPSMALSDYRMDFTGRIERKSLGWVYRASSTRNYYGARVELVRDGRFPTVALSRFTVIESRETPAPPKLIPVMLEAGKPYQVRFEAKGPKFTVWVQNQVVDLWEDGQLKTGGVGFFNERQEQAKILDFRLSVQR
jgi:hypothetical protein